MGQMIPHIVHYVLSKIASSYDAIFGSILWDRSFFNFVHHVVREAEFIPIHAGEVEDNSEGPPLHDN